MTLLNSPPRPLRLSETAEAWIAACCDKLQSGTLELWQLPGSLRELYLLADANARADLEQQLHAANADADRYYVAALRARLTQADLTEHEAGMLEQAESSGNLATEADVPRVVLDAAQTSPPTHPAIPPADSRPAAWEVQA